MEKRLFNAQSFHFPGLAIGKMLRTRFAARLFSAPPNPHHAAEIKNACVAAELVHTASLVHDDIIDGALIRRSQPALWKMSGPNSAVLMGDLLYCESLLYLLKDDNMPYAGIFVEKVREVCLAEIEQEIELRTRRIDHDCYIQIVRSKTGPLFAFLGYVCGCDDYELSIALEEAGYLTGTAYQIADDLIDVVGSEPAAGKTLGTDELRKKFTIAQGPQDDYPVASHSIESLVYSAVSLLTKWPNHQKALFDFFITDLQPILDKHCVGVDLKSDIAA